MHAHVHVDVHVHTTVHNIKVIKALQKPAPATVLSNFQ